MKPVIKTILLSGLLASLATLSQAQTAQGMGPGAGAGGPGPSSDMRARMQDHMVRRAADIKAKLKLTPEQEGAWTTYIAAMKPPANIKRPDRAEIEKLTTPERLDRMRELRKQRDAEMDKREDATRTFYATLNPEQKKIFDANTARPFHNRGPQGPRKE
jgi:Spy/CpxP family protein refolding chaperone